MQCHSFSPIVLYDHVTLREAHCILVQGALPSYQGSPAEIGIQDSKKKKNPQWLEWGAGSDRGWPFPDRGKQLCFSSWALQEGTH